MRGSVIRNILKRAGYKSAHALVARMRGQAAVNGVLILPNGRKVSEKVWTMFMVEYEPIPLGHKLAELVPPVATSHGVKIDAINPAHYRQGNIETIEYIESLGISEDFCAGNAIKYLSRYKLKGGVEDVKKARWYVERLIKLLEK